MRLNGQIVKLNKGVSVLLFLQQNKYDISKIAVALNENIVPTENYANIMLQDEDSLEVVSFVGGG